MGKTKKQGCRACERPVAIDKREDGASITSVGSTRATSTTISKYATAFTPKELGPPSKDKTQINAELGAVYCEPDTSRATSDPSVFQALGPA